MTNKFLLQLLLVLVTVLSTPLAYSDTTYPVTVTDDRPKKVRFTQRPQSVASISVFGADVLAALGKQATGLSTLNHKQSAFLGERIQHMQDLGEVHETNMELLTQLNPDLIIGIRQYTEPFAKKFEEIGQFLAYDLVTYEDSVRAIESTATALGLQTQAKKLNADFATTLKQHHDKAPGGLTAIMLWHWANIPYAFYDQHLTINIMQQLKVKNAMGTSPYLNMKKPDSAVISMETLLKLNPDVIISFKGDDGPFMPHPVWQHLKAIKNKRAYRVNDQYVMSHGPIARDMVLREMAYLLYPKHFPKPTDIPTTAQAHPMTFSSR